LKGRYFLPLLIVYLKLLAADALKIASEQKTLPFAISQDSGRLKRMQDSSVPNAVIESAKPHHETVASKDVSRSLDPEKGDESGRDSRKDEQSQQNTGISALAAYRVNMKDLRNGCEADPRQKLWSYATTFDILLRLAGLIAACAAGTVSCEGSFAHSSPY
jgi:hypothetical protein